MKLIKEIMNNTINYMCRHNKLFDNKQIHFIIFRRPITIIRKMNKYQIVISVILVVLVNVLVYYLSSI